LSKYRIFALKRKIPAILALFSAVVFIGWGNIGHKIINGSSTASFPPQLNFLQNWTDDLIAHGSDADYRKSSDPDEDIKHYIDLDNFPEFVSTGQIHQNFDSLAALHGNDFVMQQGILPWAIIETAHSLETAFRNRRWDEAMLLAADLGHYIGDAHMPLHLTKNYNGQYSSQYGVHSRYESKLIDSYQNEIIYPGDSAEYVADLSDFTFKMLFHNYAYTDSVLSADKKATAFAGNTRDNIYYNKLWQISKSYTIRLLQSASNKLASMIYTCWINAGSPRPTTEVCARQQRLENYVLYQNHPNPFNAQTNICFEMRRQEMVSIVVYNMRGQLIETLFAGIKAPGSYRIKWDAAGLGGGMYLIRMQTADFIDTRKCIVIK
jgi:hypothetical protein